MNAFTLHLISLAEIIRRCQVVRAVRDTNQSRLVKRLYDYKCQVCEWMVYPVRLCHHDYCGTSPICRKKLDYGFHS